MGFFVREVVWWLARPIHVKPWIGAGAVYIRHKSHDHVDVHLVSNGLMVGVKEPLRITCTLAVITFLKCVMLLSMVSCD